MDMFVQRIDHESLGDGKCFRMSYILGCENLHKVEIPGEIYTMPEDNSPEQRVIKYLIQQTENRDA